MNFEAIVIILKAVSIVLPISIVIYSIGEYIEYKKRIHNGFIGALGKFMDVTGTGLFLTCLIILALIIIRIFYWYLWK